MKAQIVNRTVIEDIPKPDSATLVSFILQRQRCMHCIIILSYMC